MGVRTGGRGQCDETSPCPLCKTLWPSLEGQHPRARLSVGLALRAWDTSRRVRSSPNTCHQIVSWGRGGECPLPSAGQGLTPCSTAPPTHPYLPSHQVQGHLSPGRTFPKSSPWQQDRGVMTRQRPGTERLTRGAGVRGEQGGIYSMSRQTWAQTSSFSLVCNLRKFPNHSELPFLPWWKPRYSFLAHRAVTRR